MTKKRRPRKAPKIEADPLDEYSTWDKRIARAFYYAIIISSAITVLGIWLGIFDLLVVTGNLEFFLSIGLGFQIAIISAIITGHLVLLVIFYTLFRGGILKLCRTLFKDRKIAKKYEDYPTLRWLIAILLTGLYITIFGLVIGIVPIAVFESIAGFFVWMAQTFSFWQWVLFIGLTSFSIVGLFLLGFVIWNHGVYVVLKRVKRIEDEIEVEERIKIDSLQDADEETLRKAFEKNTGKRAIYRGKETKGYMAWKKKVIK